MKCTLKLAKREKTRIQCKAEKHVTNVLSAGNR